MSNQSFAFQLLLLMMALSGCTLLPQQPPPPRHHDFGLPSQSQQELVAAVPVRLRLASVQAPVWLDTTEIHYRLLYDEPTRLRAYAQNRWIAPPAALLEQHWREALAKFGPDKRTGTTATPIYQLDVVVDRFEQVFDAPHSAYAVIGLRAVLMSSNHIGPVAERHFIARRACDPQVQGAINALAMLADSTLEDVLRWVIHVDKSVMTDQSNQQVSTVHSPFPGPSVQRIHRYIPPRRGFSAGFDKNPRLFLRYEPSGDCQVSGRIWNQDGCARICWA